MSKQSYVRPDITRALLRNPQREGQAFTDDEQGILHVARERIPQERRSYQLVSYQYDAPFFYDNFRVELGRPWENATNHNEEDLPEERWGNMSDYLRTA